MGGLGVYVGVCGLEGVERDLESHLVWRKSYGRKDDDDDCDDGFFPFSSLCLLILFSYGSFYCLVMALYVYVFALFL